MTELPPPVADSETPTDDSRASKSRTRLIVVLVAIGVALTLVVGLAFFGITSLLSAASDGPKNTISQAEVAAAAHVIVLQATDAKGNVLTGLSVNTMQGLLSHRLDRANIPFSKVAFRDDLIYVILHDDVDPETISKAANALSQDVNFEFRRVLAADQSCTFSAGAATNAQDQFLACDSDGVGYMLGPVEVRGHAIKGASAVSTGSGSAATDQWAVIITFTHEGSREFEDLTSRLAEEQPPLNRMAMVLDGDVLSAPTVLAAITGTEVQITGEFDKKHAETLATSVTLASDGLHFTVQSATTR